jgi:protein required for attachment to host cells
MRRKTVWTVVASRARARIFSTGPDQVLPLAEIYVLVDPGARVRARDVIADRPGRTRDRYGHGRHAMEQHSPQRESARRFVARICAWLEQASRQNRFQSLVLVASPEFTGLLRNRMSPRLRQCIDGEIHKNISTLPDHAIRALLSVRAG